MTAYHRLPLLHAKNVRDLGGFPCRNGRTRFHLFCRAATLSRLDAADADFLRRYGIRTILDLRSPEERVELPDSAHLNNFVQAHVDLSLYPSFEERLDEIIGQNIPVSQTYLEQLEQDGVLRTLFLTLERLIREEKTGILFHCLEGKDRTGLLAMLLMGLVGCSDEDIYSEYAVSSTLLGYCERSFEDKMARFFLTTPYTMQELLRLLREKYGSIRQFLLDMDVPEICLNTIESYFVETV